MGKGEPYRLYSFRCKREVEASSCGLFLSSFYYMNKRVWGFLIWNRQFILYYLRVYFKSLTKSYFWKFLTYADSKKLLIFLNCKFQDIIAKLVQDKKSIVEICLLLAFLHVSLLIWTKNFYQQIPPWTLKVVWPLLNPTEFSQKINLLLKVPDVAPSTNEKMTCHQMCQIHKNSNICARGKIWWHKSAVKNDKIHFSVFFH